MRHWKRGVTMADTQVRTGVPTEAFRKGEVFIDYPFEDVAFRYTHGKAFAKPYGKPERPIPNDHEMYNQAILSGQQITAEEYAKK